MYVEQELRVSARYDAAVAAPADFMSIRVIKLLFSLLCAADALSSAPPITRTRVLTPIRMTVAEPKPTAKLSAAWPPSSLSILPASALRAALPVGASALLLSATLPQLPEFSSLDSLSASPAVFATIAAALGVVVLAWRRFGTELHPITAKARGLESPLAPTFQALGLFGPLAASAALATGWQALPVAGTPIELAHCVLPFVVWQADVRLLRWLNPHVDWPASSVSLPANYASEHGENPVGAVLALLGVFMFEVYVQQLLASGLTIDGWPLIASAALIALNAGFVNHALANGVLNGILCAEFYWTVSLMFGLSNSALPVGIYHHLMYSMPLFVKSYDEAVEASPSPILHTALLHGTLMIWHLALFAAISFVGTPTARELTAWHVAFALPQLDALAWPEPSVAFGLGCLGLFGFAASGVAGEAEKQGRDPSAL